MVTARYSDQQGSKSRQNPGQVQPTEYIGNLSAFFLALGGLHEDKLCHIFCTYVVLLRISCTWYRRQYFRTVSSMLQRKISYSCFIRTITTLGIMSRARSLRNLLVSGNECGRVFPAGVGPGSPSRDAANWLPSRFSLSVETRRRYGWLRMMVFPGARLFPSPNLVPFGRVAARERQGALSRRAW